MLCARLVRTWIVMMGHAVQLENLCSDGGRSCSMVPTMILPLSYTLRASSLPFSSSMKASLTSAVKNVLDTTTVFCALFSKIHCVRAFSAYAGMAALNSALTAPRIASTTFCSQTSTGPSQLQSLAKGTYSPSPAEAATPQTPAPAATSASRIMTTV